MSDSNAIVETGGATFTLDEANDTPTRHLFKLLSNQVSLIDEKLDAGSVSAGKRKITSNLIETHQNEWEPVAKNINEELQGMVDTGDLGKFAGSYFGLLKAISDVYETKAREYITKVFETQPTPDDVPSEEEKKSLTTDRSELVKKIKTLLDMAIMFQEAPQTAEDGKNAEWPLPRRRGASGARGKRALSYYTWTVNGEAIPDGDTIKGISAALGLTRGEFSKALRAINIDTKEPPNPVNLTVGDKVVLGTRPTDSVVEDDEDEDDDDDEEDEDDDEE